MVKSWDCFDTLLGRYFHQPISIFNIISQKINKPDFASQRIHAEKIATKKTLQGIYDEMSVGDPDLELQIEKEYTYPIKSNFDMVSDGDIIVSDMYLSATEILEILRYHGLDKDVRVISTYGGKSQGYVWKDLKEKEIEYHIGDNQYSDIFTPRLNGIKTVYYGNTSLTKQEKTIERYCPQLAYWVKYIRLRDPYFVPRHQFVFTNGSLTYSYGLYWIIEKQKKIYNLKQIDGDDKFLELYDQINNISYIVYDTYIEVLNQDDKSKEKINGEWLEQPVNTNRFDEKILWSEQCSYNIPLLISVAYNLPKNIIFSYRDCVYLKRIYDSIFDTDIPILESCRNSFYNPFNEQYVKYVCDITKDKTIVDLHGSGWSSNHFFKNHVGIDQKVLFVSEHSEEMKKNIDIKNFSMCFDHIFEDNPYINAHHHNRYSSKIGLRCCSGTMLEKFNIPPNLGQLIGWENGPIRKKSEHNNNICRIFSAAVDCAISVSKVYTNQLNEIEEDTIVALLNKMNKDNYVNTVVHSLWEKFKSIRIN